MSDSVQIEGGAHLKITSRKRDFDDFHHVHIKRHIEIYTTHLHNYKRSTREQIIPPEPARTCKLMRMTGSKKYSPVGTKAQPLIDDV